MNSIADIRKDYRMRTLSENDTAASPVEQFEKWWTEILASDIDEANAMTLATVGREGRPSARIVLLKGLQADGFVFFTNYESRKGLELRENDHAALVFFWKELERQVRIEGSVTRLTEKESDAYFQSRPRESRIGAWSSPQSKVISTRNMLDENVAAYHKKFDGKEIERPLFWGGYMVKPQMVEFWQGRSNRLHDRIRYREEAGTWIKERLAP